MGRFETKWTTRVKVGRQP